MNARTPSSPHRAGTRLRVLLVEDDAVTARTMERIITRGFAADVRWEASAEGGAQSVVAQGWDLVLIDINLPGASGLDLLRASKARMPEVPHLVTSGLSQGETVIAAMREGADDYLVKPVRAEALAQAVARATARAARSASGPERVLAIGAHPDDVEIGVGGILLRHRTRGDATWALTLTRGERGGDALERAREARRAAAVLGATALMGGLTDTKVVETDAIATLAKAVEEIRPTIIYTHTSKDVHQDHRLVHAATLSAARQVPRIYAYQAPSTTPDFRPTRFVEMGSFFDGKLAAIRAHESQADRPYLTEELLRSTCLYWGRFAGGGMVEPLEVARETQGVETTAAAAALAVTA